MAPQILRLSWASPGEAAQQVADLCRATLMLEAPKQFLMACLENRKVEQLVHTEAAKSAGVPVIRRFSGGGTVIVDRDTLFATLIMQGAALPHVECYPRPIMRWSESFYARVFSEYGSFSLREHGAPWHSLCLWILHAACRCKRARIVHP